MRLPPLTAPLICGAGRCSRLVRCDSVITAMLDFGQKSNGLWRCIDIFSGCLLALRCRQAFAKAAYGLRLDPEHGPAMDEQELRRLFTEIGCFMEDAGVTALVWRRDDTRSISDRAAELRGAYNKIGALLDTVDSNVR